MAGKFLEVALKKVFLSGLPKKPSAQWADRLWGSVVTSLAQGIRTLFHVHVTKLLDLNISLELQKQYGSADLVRTHRRLSPTWIFSILPVSLRTS